MNVALLGASGNAGSRILSELLARGHRVVAIARHPHRISNSPNMESAAADANDQGRLTELISGRDALISAVKFTSLDIPHLIETVRRAAVPRFMVVGGAGSLELSPGVREVDGPHFPAHVKPEALEGAAFLDELRASDLNWTFLSPSRIFFAGERTDRFRIGADRLLFDATGKSSISFEDYAVALVDELERPQHLRCRFTVGY